MMKATVYLSVLVFICIQNTLQRPFKVIFDPVDLECITELGLNKNTVAQAFTADFKLVEKIPEINEYVACSWNKTEFWNEDGNLDKHTIKQYFLNFLEARNQDSIQSIEQNSVDEVLNEAIKSCSAVIGDDLGDTAVKVYNCLIDYLLGKKLFSISSIS